MRCALRGSLASGRASSRFVLFLISLFVAATARAGFNRWTSNGPWSGYVTIASDPSDPLTAYAAAQYTGVFRTRDGGATWQPITAGLFDLWITSIAVDPQTPSTLFASSYQSFVYKSTDGGDHWTSLYVIDNQSAYSLAYGLAIDPLVPSTVYAATLDGVWKTVDGGCSWASSNQGLPSGQANTLSVAVDPGNPSVVLVGTAGRGIFRSSNGGASWDPVHSILSTERVQQISFDPTNPAVVYAATSYFFDTATASEEGGYVYRSQNGGTDWAPLAALPNEPFTGVLADPFVPQRVFVTGYSSGIRVSPDGGASFTFVNGGLPGPSAAHIVAGPHPDLLWAAVGGAAVSKSTDGGVAWQDSSAGIRGLLSPGLLIHPDVNPIVWVTNYWGGAAPVFKTTDTGRHWSVASTGLPVNGPLSIAATAGPPLTLFAGLSFRAGIFRSTDEGESWSPAAPLSDQGTPDVYQLVVPPTEPQKIYAVAGSLFVSGDGGDSWGPTSPDNHYVELLSADTQTAGTFLAIVDGTFQRSTDFGATWKPWGAGLVLNNGLALAQSPANPNVVLVGTQGDPFLSAVPLSRSTDRGAHFTPAFAGMQATDGVASIVFDPVHPSRIYASTSPFGHPSAALVYRSLDAGATWQPFDRGLPRNILDGSTLAISRNGGVIQLAGFGGVWELTPSPRTPPSLASVEPASGGATGGTAVTLTGSDLEGVGEALFGGAAASSVQVLDAEHVVATTPPGEPGLVSVTVRTAEPQSDTRTRAFVYDYLDVPEGSLFHDSVVALALREVTGGCGGGNFCPGAGLNRGQAAVQIEKALHGADFPFEPPFVQPGFPTQDVELCTGFAPYIQQLVLDGITAGCGDFDFCPSNPVTRAQMAVFLLRARHGAQYLPPPATGAVFADVPADSFAADYIEAAAAEGITAGCGGGNFCPDAVVTRGQAAALIDRALPAPGAP